ncbi:MAG: PD-(D/E)XK nuclease family protein [Bacteroidota bacterium]
MMQPILELLARYLTDEPVTNSGETTIILPNRRAGLFLQRHLARHTREVGWLPRIYSITEFIEAHSRLETADPVELLFTLYDIYREVHTQPESLDEFYYWGEIMLNDFDELDKYLVEPELLFRNIVELKEIDEPLAGLDQEQLSFIRQFWEGFHQGRDTPEKEQFREIWSLLPLLYSKLREELNSRGEGYQGMQYREITERIKKGNIRKPECERIIVAGFNALNGCEKRIFSWLKQHGALFFWDYDLRYIEESTDEAGRFMRDNLTRFPPPLQLEPFRGMENEKEIRIFELPTDVLQTKTVHRILMQKEVSTMTDCTDTAVVLCDEALLMPLLMSVPDTIEEVNVTMGYPMSNTPVFGFVDALFRLQHNMRRGPGEEVSFYHKDVQAILMHPYMEKPGEGSAHPLVEQMAAGNLIRVERSFFKSEFEKMIFRSVDKSEELIGYLRGIFLHILANLAGEEQKVLPGLHREFVFRMLVHLNKLETQLTARPDMPMQVLERLFRRVVATLRVPFEGEPLSGLQLMGFLETRMLDFKHVILLSMNEEVMPASPFRQSYVPYALRLAFGMPAREDMDAIYAYYFNRLLQRAEKVDLLFNSTSEGVRTGEMSRYLHQLIYSRGIGVIRPGMDMMAREVPGVVVEHTPEVDLKLRRYFPEEGGTRYLSPSAINTYIDCSLKFYLRYLAGIGESDQVQEEIDAAGFGTVVHDAMKLLYEEIAEKNHGILEGQDLRQLHDSDRIKEVLTRLFRDEHYKGRKNAVIEGRNIIILRVMMRYLKKIIRTDITVAPVTLVSAEKNYQRELAITTGGQCITVRIGGTIDRVDRVGGRLRVIDYKTGGAGTGFPSLESLFDGTHNNRNGAALQTLLYGWLVSDKHPGEPVTPGLYVMKALYKSGFDPVLTMGSNRQKQPVDSFASVEEEFLERLGEVLEKLYDPLVPFEQAENETRCRYCDFRGICNRTSID